MTTSTRKRIVFTVFSLLAVVTLGSLRGYTDKFLRSGGAQDRAVSLHKSLPGNGSSVVDDQHHDGRGIGISIDEGAGHKGPSYPYRYKEQGHKHRLNLAQAGLNVMDQNRVLDTAYTNYDTVVDKGFPFSSWNPCTLEHIYQAKYDKYNDEMSLPPLRIAILGGSGTARAASNCSSEGPLKNQKHDPRDVLGGRYSNILQAKLLSFSDNTTKQSHWNVEVLNMGQGATTSIWSGMVMDEMFLPNQTDVLVWEYAVNDFWSPANSINPARSLGFWLNRVKALYAREGKPPPPIILLFFWECLIGDPKKTSYVLRNGLGKPATAARKAIEYFKYQEGWNIQVISVGTVLNRTRFVQNVKGIFDDRHHPGCLGTHLIANMMQHAIYSDLATCTAEKLAESERLPVSDSKNQSTKSVIDPFRNMNDFGGNRYMRSFWESVIRDDVRIGSITQWQPNTGVGSWGLNLANANAVRKFPVAITGKHEVTRRDRKYVFELPRCDLNESRAFILEEPDLQWLGIGVKSLRILGLRVNGGKFVDMTYYSEQSKNNLVHIFATVWIRLSDIAAPAQQYTMTVCSRSRNVRPDLNTIIGIMHPKDKP